MCRVVADDNCFRLYFRQFELREARLPRGRGSPARNLAACTRREVDASWSGLVPSCIRSRQRPLASAKPRGNPRRHTASLAPRGSAAFACRTGSLIPRGADRRASLLLSAPLKEQTAHHAPKSHIGRTTGRCSPSGPVRLQTSRCHRPGPSAANRHKAASGRSETACAPRRRSSA